LLIVLVVIGSAVAVNHVYERSVITGIGYRSHEMVGMTSDGYSGQKIVKKVSGSGSFYDRTEFEMDSVDGLINYTQEAEFEYFPVSYQTGVYDQKWIDKTCVVNYDAGGVVTEEYTHVESLQKDTEISSVGNGTTNSLEAYISTDAIGVVHIGWVSVEKGDKRYYEVGRSVEDAVGVFSIDKLIQLMGNSTSDPSRVDWLPCI
jgi:hypothetical protein